MRRRKRAWISPPTKLVENDDYTQKTSIAKIHSDQQAHTKVEYYLTGPGADEPPVNLFVVDRGTGSVRITGVVDREQYPFFNLTGIAKYTNGTLAETGISLYVTILDINDNAPRFEPQSGEVFEGSRGGTFVMQIEGKDDDQPGTINSTISYSIISQEPEGLSHMFRIDEQTGKLYVKEPALDRERVELYRLVVQGADMAGAAGGLKGSGTVEIRVLDINDNVPTLEQCEYSASVDENVHNVVVSRIKARDRDLEHTDNWRAVFVIARGNEDNLFAIETDENTNEGVLKLIKPLDFEKVQNLELTLLIRNVAPFTKGEVVMTDVGVRVRITVNNVVEDPAFIPAVREITVSEDPKDQPKDGIIMVFTAVDPDTGKAAHVRYAKAFDPGNWFTVDKHTAEIKLNKKPDRESALVVNGRYVAKIVAISNERPSATATGTIIIRVADANDHCPTLTSTHSSLCADRKTVYITALDEDASPNAAPFTFTVIPEGSQGSWHVEVINETTAALHSQKNLWPGIYKLQVMLADAQGRSCPAHEEYTLHVCTCTSWEMCHADRRATSSLKLSAAAIGLLLLPAGLLLLVPLLLLFCQCGGANTIFPDQFTDLPFQATEHLMAYHTEGKGTDFMWESKMGTAAKRQQSPNAKVIKTDKVSTFYKESAESRSWKTWEMSNSGFRSHSHRAGAGRTPLFEHIALPEAFLKSYYAQVQYADPSMCPLVQRAAEAAPVKEGLLDFTFEGQGSSAGSLSCCSLRDPQDDLGFLDDLSTKFKTLAEVCSPA
uniref:Si:ch73-74h11.1 n=1 Tax=Tetraodon nigroviridis TaxID=99883 RepID=H3CYP7_TETNG